MKSVHFSKDHLQGIVTLCLVFCISKDLYLVITLKIINLIMKSMHFSWKAPVLFGKKVHFSWKAPALFMKSNKNSRFNTNLSFWPGLSQSAEGRPTSYVLIFCGEKWKAAEKWKAHEKRMKSVSFSRNERPLARNCNPMFSCFEPTNRRQVSFLVCHVQHIFLDSLSNTALLHKLICWMTWLHTEVTHHDDCLCSCWRKFGKSSKPKCCLQIDLWEEVHHVANNANINFLDCAIEHGFILLKVNFQ